MRFALLVLLLAGCGSIQPGPGTGRHFTLAHGSMRFGDAMQGASEHCARLGLQARHLGTDNGGGLLLSRFECVR
jgi:hypothetical protein